MKLQQEFLNYEIYSNYLTRKGKKLQFFKLFQEILFSLKFSKGFGALSESSFLFYPLTTIFYNVKAFYKFYNVKNKKTALKMPLYIKDGSVFFIRILFSSNTGKRYSRGLVVNLANITNSLLFSKNLDQYLENFLVSVRNRKRRVYKRVNVSSNFQYKYIKSKFLD